MDKTDAFLTLNRRLTIVAWTAGVAGIFGYEAHEILGKSVLVLVPEDQLSKARAVLTQVKAEGRVDGFHAVRLTRDGERIPIIADLLAVRDESGEHCATQITVRRQ